jgi:hypothetical protein
MTTATNGTHGPTGHQTDSDLDALYAWHMPTPAVQPLPEAALSLTLKGTVQGIEAMLTIRGQSPAEFQRNLASVKGLLDQPQPSTPQAASQGEGKDWCSTHQVSMKWNAGKDGRQGWFSHKTPEGWCHGK